MEHRTFQVSFVDEKGTTRAKFAVACLDVFGALTYACGIHSALIPRSVVKCVIHLAPLRKPANGELLNERRKGA